MRLVVRGRAGQEVTVAALLDTGFNGPLSLPPAMVAELGLPLRQASEVLLADGTRTSVQNHTARLLWEGFERPVRVLATGEQPLAGMALFIGYKICIEVVDGGEVVAETL